MRSRRCGICAINYPPKRKFETCPKCEEPTSPMYQAEPIPEDDAEKLWARAEFERRYGPAEVTV